MPTYGYECKSCKHTFDVFQSIKDEPLKVCPECGKELRRLITGGTGVIFKGGGFYVTDKGGSGGKPKGSSSAKSSGDAAKTGPAPESPCAGCAKPEACPKAANN